MNAKRVTNPRRLLSKIMSSDLSLVDKAWVAAGHPRAAPLRAATRVLPYRPAPIDGPKWEEQYRTGHWEYLEDLEQAGRYAVITGYVSHFGDGGSVADLGSGHGILHRHLQVPGYSSYLGVDISSEAVAQAEQHSDERSSHVAADLAEYEPTRSFDVIVFNESLYYFQDPVGLLQRYESYLEPGGAFVVSMYGKSSRNARIWQMVGERYATVDGTQVDHEPTGKTWHVRVLVPSMREG